MKKVFNITFGTMLAATLSSVVLAGENDFLSRSGIWVTGLYTESSNNSASYGDLVQSPPPTLNPFDGTHRHVFVDPDMNFDYAVGYSYHIPCSFTRFFVTYDHYNDDNDSTNSDVRNLGLTPPSFAYGHVKYHAQEFRIGLGHSLMFGRQFHLDLKGFVEWDQVKRNIDERITTEADGTRVRNTYESVSGWGPGIGARIRAIPFMRYENWGVFAGTNTSLFWADNHYEAIASTSDELIYHYDPESTDSVVGKIDISFGINYSRQIRDLSCSIIDIALGVRYMNMFNVFKNGNAYQNPVYLLSSFVPFAANLGYPNDWGRVGPFLTFAIGGSNA